MPENDELDLTTGEDVDRAVNMVTEDDNDNFASDDCNNDNCDRDVSDEEPENSENYEDNWLKPTTQLNKDLSDVLSEMVLRLCSICNNFFTGRFKINPKWHQQKTLEGIGIKVYHSSLLSLEESVNGGCPLCKDLSNSLEKLLKRDPRLQKITDQSSSIWCEPKLWHWEGDEEIPGLMMSFYLCGQDDQLLSDESRSRIKGLTFFSPEYLGIGPEFRDLALRETTANSARSISLARSWYKECLVHSSCRKWEKTSTAPPTRLVRVQRLGYGASSRIAAHVCETKDLSHGVTCRYTTLSHRWGDSTMVKLEKGNIDIFRRKLPVDQLPILFQDAMYMTCQLDIEYIWIDCLCILQGSKRDWELEATRMGDYYRYAECNLSATGYKDGNMGFFGERVALSFINYPIRTDLVLVSEVDGQEAETYCEGIYMQAYCGDFEDEIIQGALSSRGWVAQERALSPGILHFTPRQMWWECTGHIVNEAFPTITLPWWNSRDLGAGAIRSINANSSPDQIYQSWRAFIEHYATTKLTFETDRFPAVTGIARIYDGLLDDNFIAGMWEGDLVRSLVWETHKKARRIPSVQIAPSWSWASLPLAHEAPISGSPINGIRFRVLSETSNFRSDLQTTTFEKSSVRGLEMRGPLRRLSFRLKDLPLRREFLMGAWIVHDVEDASVFSGQDTTGQEWRWEDHSHILPLWKEGVHEIRATSLLLQQVPGTELHGTFRRLGTVTFKFPSDELCNKYLGLVEENGSYKPSVGFEECGLQDFVLI